MAAASEARDRLRPVAYLDASLGARTGSDQEGHNAPPRAALDAFTVGPYKPATMAHANKVELMVITPERQVLADQGDVVVIPAHDGELGVLPQRAPLMCELGIGSLYYRSGGRTQRVFIDGGFAQVLDNRVTVLSGNALKQEEVTAEVVSKADQAAAKAESREDRLRAGRRAAVLRGLQTR